MKNIRLRTLCLTLIAVLSVVQLLANEPHDCYDFTKQLDCLQPKPNTSTNDYFYFEDNGVRKLEFSKFRKVRLDNGQYGLCLNGSTASITASIAIYSPSYALGQVSLWLSDADNALLYQQYRDDVTRAWAYYYDDEGARQDLIVEMPQQAPGMVTINIPGGMAGHDLFIDFALNRHSPQWLVFTSVETRAPQGFRYQTKLEFDANEHYMVFNSDYRVTANCTPSSPDAPISYSSSDTGTATIDAATGRVTAIGDGVVDITASVPENGYNGAATATCRLNVLPYKEYYSLKADAETLIACESGSYPYTLTSPTLGVTYQALADVTDGLMTIGDYNEGFIGTLDNVGYTLKSFNVQWADDPGCDLDIYTNSSGLSGGAIFNSTYHKDMTHLGTMRAGVDTSFDLGAQELPVVIVSKGNNAVTRLKDVRFEVHPQFDWLTPVITSCDPDGMTVTLGAINTTGDPITDFTSTACVTAPGSVPGEADFVSSSDNTYLVESERCDLWGTVTAAGYMSREPVKIATIDIAPQGNSVIYSRHEQAFDEGNWYIVMATTPYGAWAMGMPDGEMHEAIRVEHYGDKLPLHEEMGVAEFQCVAGHLVEKTTGNYLSPMQVKPLSLDAQAPANTTYNGNSLVVNGETLGFDGSKFGFGIGEPVTLYSSGSRVNTSVDIDTVDTTHSSRLYNIIGVEIKTPAPGSVYIEVGDNGAKIMLENK